MTGPQAGHQRARGALRVSFRTRQGETQSVLGDLRQDGCLKARFPRPERGAWTGAVLLNTGGGVAAGDRLSTEAAVLPGARATLATQAAERFYRAVPGSDPAQVGTHLRVGAGAALEWLPQEAILFDGCALDRGLDVELEADSWFLGVESLVFGRALMGERVASARLHDRLRIRRDGRLILHDAVRLEGAVADTLAREAVAGEHRAVATLVHAAPDAESRLEALRGALAGTEGGASAWDGLLVARVLAPDARRLRAVVVRCLTALRAGRPLPRVWLC